MKVGFYLQATEHIGVEILSAVLKQGGHQTELFFDPRVWRDGYAYHETLARWWSVEDMIVEEILNANLDVLCFSVVTDNYATALRVAAKVKEHINIPTVFGGVHCTSVPERVAVKPQVDYTVVGEGEYPLLELVEALAQGERDVDIANVWHRRSGGDLRSTPTRPTISDLDSLPFLDKDLFYDKVPKFHQERYVTVASRGCVYACTFCNNSMYKNMYNKQRNGKWHRRRSVDSLLQELTIARQKYNYRYVFFWDEIFVDNREWLEEFCDKYAKTIRLPFWCYGYARYINPEIVEMLEEAGCREMNVGIQTISPETRKIIKRGDRNEKIEEAVRLLRNSKIYLATGNILQLPGQDREEVFHLAEWYNEHRVDRPIVGFLRYYPRTDIVQTGLDAGVLTQKDVERIEEAETENPFTVSTGKDGWEFKKAQTLILLTPFAPKWLVPYLLKSGMWRYVPTGTITVILLTWIGDLRSFFTGKWHEPETYSTRRYVWLMAKYGLDKLRWKLRKVFAGPTRPELKKVQPNTETEAT